MTARLWSTTGGTQALVALVEDDSAVRWSIKRLLENAGFAVLDFDSGDALLAEPLPDGLSVIILDVHLPGPSGLEVLKTLGKRCGIPPVIILTGLVGLETAIEARALGAAAYLTKPCPSAVLLDTIERVIGGSADQ